MVECPVEDTHHQVQEPRTKPSLPFCVGKFPVEWNIVRGVELRNRSSALPFLAPKLISHPPRWLCYWLQVCVWEGTTIGNKVPVGHQLRTWDPEVV